MVHPLRDGGGPRTQHPDGDRELKGAGNLDFLNDEKKRYRDTSSFGVPLHQVKDGVLTLTARLGPKPGRYESAMIRKAAVPAERDLYPCTSSAR